MCLLCATIAGVVVFVVIIVVFVAVYEEELLNEREHCMKLTHFPKNNITITTTTTANTSSDVTTYQPSNSNYNSQWGEF